MPYKNFQDSGSDDDDDDELFSYLQTAHRVKHVKIEPMKACDDDIIASYSQISTKIGDKYDSHHMSSPDKNHRQSQQSVPRKRNVRHQTQSGKSWYDQKNKKDIVPEEYRIDHSSSGMKDILNGSQFNNNKETNVHEFEILNSRKTDIKQNVKFYESPEILIDIEKQASCDIKGPTQDFEHNTDGGAVVNSICTPEKGNKAGNSNRGNDMPWCKAEYESCQTEFSSLDNKYYLINERDWMSLFSSLQMNKQEYPLLSFDLPNSQICPTINEFTRNKDGRVNVTDAITGQESSTDNSDTKNCLNDATVNESPVKQTSESEPQNVEVVYVRIEDEKLKCDMNDSPEKNIVVKSPIRCNNTSNCTKNSEVGNSCNNNTTLGEGNVSDRYSEHDFHGRFVRINNKLTRLLYLKDQSGIEKVQSKPVDLVEENTVIVDDPSESDCETAFFIDLDNWHETRGESDLKIYPISIQDDSYTFLQDSSSVEQYIARPLNQNEECMIVDEPASELADSHTLCLNQRLSSSQGSQHSDKIVSDKSPLKKITLSPCKLVRSPKKSMCQIKTEVKNSSADIIKNLWENFKSDNGRQRLPGATNSEDVVVENSVNLSDCPLKKDACIESDDSSDYENDLLLRYLRRSKMENAADASSSVYYYDGISSPIRNSLCVQTNISNNDHKFEPNKHVTKCMQSEIKKRAKSSEIHKCNDAILEKLDRDIDSDKIKAKCSGKERIRKEVNSKAEICPPSENKLKMALDYKGSLNCAEKKLKRKPSVDQSVSERKTQKSDPKKRNGKTNVKKLKLSLTEISSSVNVEKIQTSLEGSQRIKASKQPSQSKNKVIKKSPSLKNIPKDLPVESKVLDGEKTKDFDNGMALCIGSVCNELDTFERERSDENNSGTATSSHSLWASCEKKNSRNEKKKLITDTVESGNCNKYDEMTNDKDCTVSDKLKAKIERKSAGCKLKKKEVMTDVSKGQKNLNFFGRGIKVGKNVSDRNALKVNNKKEVKRKVKSKRAVKTKLGVVCSSTELEDLNKWSKIKNSKVEFLEHLFHIKLKEAVEPDEKLPDPVACTENHVVKNSGYLETSIDFDSLEKDLNCGVPVKCTEEVVGKVTYKKRQMNDVQIHDKIEDTTEHSTNINATTSVENIKKNDLISEQVNNVLHRTCEDFPKFESFKLDLMKKVNAVENENEFKSDNDKVLTEKLKPDNLVPVIGSFDANIMHTCSKICPRTRRKPKYSKKKDIQMQLINTNQKSCKRQGSMKRHKKLHEVNTNPDSERRHQRIKSLKQLQSKSKTVNKRKTEVWKEKLQDEAFKFNFDKDLHKTYRPLNVKEMIRKILIPLSGSEGKKNAKDMKRHRKRKVQRITSKRGGHTSRLRVTSECDDAWFSDSGPSESYPAFKFATTDHTILTTTQSIEEKPLS